MGGKGGKQEGREGREEHSGKYKFTTTTPVTTLHISACTAVKECRASTFLKCNYGNLGIV